MKLTIMLLGAITVLGTGTAAFAQDPVKLSPKMYTVLLENDQVRVLEFRCAPGEKEPMHSHPPMVAYSLTEAKARASTPDGKTEEIDSKPGTTVWMPVVTHAWDCLGTSQQRTILMELKSGAKP